MKQLVFAAFLSVLAVQPSAAQDDDDGSSLFGRGAQDFLEDLLLEMEPAWRELREFMDAMGPAMMEVFEQVKDWSAYEPPEILDNGDIIIRRKPEKDDTPAPEPEPMPQIEL